MKQAFARFHQVKNASEISSYFEGNTIASLRSARCAIFLNSSFASLAFIKKNMRNMQNFQGCVYCLILNYHGSLLQSVNLFRSSAVLDIYSSHSSFAFHKQLLYTTKSLKLCQQLFNYIFQKFCFCFKNLSVSETVGIIYTLSHTMSTPFLIFFQTPFLIFFQTASKLYFFLKYSLFILEAFILSCYNLAHESIK